MIQAKMGTGYILLSFKKGDRTDCTNFKRISVTISIMKILGKTSKNHLEKQFKMFEIPLDLIAERSCIDHVFTIRLFLEKAEIK